MRIKSIALSATLWSLLLFTLTWAGLAAFLEPRVVRTLEFRTRAALGRGPTLDPRIKIFGFDDTMAAEKGGIRLDVDDWIALFKALQAKKPKTILVDGMFATRIAADAAKAAEIAALASPDTAPIHVGSIITMNPIPYRDPVEREHFMGGWGDVAGLATAPVYAMMGAHIYGPSVPFSQAFEAIGHIVQPWPGRFAASIRIADDQVVPHLALYAGTNRSLTGDGVVVDGHLIPHDGDNLSPVNFVEPVAILPQLKTLRGVMKNALLGKPSTLVQEGDVVIIIFNFSSGNTDVLDSPWGPIPGGYIIVSIINAAMRGEWLGLLGNDFIFIAGFAILGAVLGALTPTGWFWLWLFGAGVAHLGTSLLAFTFAGTIVPWLFPLVGLAGASFTTYAVQRYLESKRRVFLEMEMETASALQQNFFPAPDAVHPAFELAAWYHPAEMVGGDWYSYRVYRDRWIHIDLGDVTGHGTGAALLASFAKGATDAIYADHDTRGAETVSLLTLHRNLNELLAKSGQLKYMTLWSMAIDIETGMCLSLNSGHRPAILVGPERKPRSIVGRISSNILGHATLPEKLDVMRTQLNGNETLLALSDGLLDVPSSFGVKTTNKSLGELLDKAPDKEVTAVRRHMLKKLALVDTKGKSFMDDVTFVIIRLKLNLPAKAVDAVAPSDEKAG